MTPIRSVLALAALVCLAAAPVFAKGLAVKKATIAEKTDAYEVTVEYPETGIAAIDKDLAAWAKSTAGDFVAEAKTDHQADENAYFLDVTYEVARNDGDVFAVMFTEDVDTGGAHPNQEFETMNYLMPDGWRVYLPELFERKALAKLSAMVTKNLIDTIATGADTLSDPDTIKEGAGPDWDNFRDFILQPKKLVIHFPPYQVAAYAAGPQVSELPLGPLKDLMRKDVRAPAPSFDCAAAATRVEKLICSDVALSRLDRDVSEAYALDLRDAENDQQRADLKQKEQVWLGQRDASCAGPDALLCMTGGYQTRLAELKKFPG